MKNQNMFTKILLACITGIGIGIPITIICASVIGGFNPVIFEFTVWTIASAMFGALTIFTFGNEKFAPLLGKILHCIGCLGITLGACAIIGYGDNFLEIVLAVVPVFVIVYVAIIVVGMISMKINAKKANEALNKK